jgi:anti-sigma factor (TIGR02949 family)
MIATEAQPDPVPGTAAHPDCGDELVRRIESFLDGELAEAEEEELRGHLTACYPCQAEVDLRDRIRALLREGCAETAPLDLVDRIRVRLQATTGE